MRVVLLAALAGCTFSTTTPPVIDDPLVDASLIDVPTITIDACQTFSTQVNTCIIPATGNMPLTLTGANIYDTGTHELRRGNMLIPVARATVDTSTGAIDVIYASDFTLAAGASLEARGPLPLAIVASGTAKIDGFLDLRGPAAGSRTDIACGLSVGIKGQNSNQGAGGGGGGAFQGDGGDGSDGNSDGQEKAGGPGGTKIPRPTGLLGGCDGGDGGDANGDGPVAGDGGGAILIAAGTSITIGASGVINAGGGGGLEGNANGRGGSGGGSGGMILLESAQVVIAGVLAANGGGGGEGNQDGRNGEDGLPSAMQAGGGKGGDPTGGDGADGGAGATLDGEDTDDVQLGGGGGGGGGVGFIAIKNAAPMITGTVSPAFMPWP